MFVVYICCKQKHTACRVAMCKMSHIIHHSNVMVNLPPVFLLQVPFVLLRINFWGLFQQHFNMNNKNDSAASKSAICHIN